MKSLKQIIVYVFLVVIALNSCKDHQKECEKHKKTCCNSNDTSNKKVFADTIIYETIINSDPQNEWSVQCLKQLKRDELIVFILNAVENEKLTPYEVNSTKELTKNELKDIMSDADYDKSKINKIQFIEKWQIDTNLFSFKKVVYAIDLGFEARDIEGNIKGYKPLFRVFFNN